MKKLGLFLLFVSQIANAELSFISNLSQMPLANFEKTTVGGLSALFKTDEGYFALSDDKGQINEPRIYRYKIENTDKGLNPTIQEVIFLKGKKGEPLVNIQIDPEGLVALPDRSFLVSSEGNVNAKPRQGPQLFHFSRNGIMLGEILFPADFTPEAQGEQKRGIRMNLGPEGLTLSPSGKVLFVAFENVLMQDGPETNYDTAGGIRVLKYELDNRNNWNLKDQKIYPLEKVEKPTKTSILLGTGISEIKAIDDDNILALERSASKDLPNIYSDIKIFRFQFSSGEPLNNKNQREFSKIKPVQKSLELDLRKVTSKFKGDKLLDNMEALEWGPEFEGSKTLLVLSDDNFSEFQRTLWVWLKFK